MRDIPSNIRVKIGRTKELRTRIMQLCGHQVASPSDGTLQEIGDYLGTMANSLRSALNYAMHDFAENYLKTVITPKEFTALERSRKLDFPYRAASKSKFDTSDVIVPIRSHFPSVYQLLETLQSYHSDNVWLVQLMDISNTDKHVDIFPIDSPFLGPMGATTNNDRFHVWGNYAVIFYKDGRKQVYSLPCYVPFFRTFVSKEGKSAIFIISTDPTNPGRPDLIEFIENAPKKVKQVIFDLYKLL